MSGDVPAERLAALRGSGTVYIAESFDPVWDDPPPLAEVPEETIQAPPRDEDWIPFVMRVDSPEPEWVPANPRFVGHWEGVLDGENALFEQGPGWNDPHEAVSWGRERSRRVLVRLGLGDPVHYSAGVESFDDLETLPWPPSVSP